MADLPASYVDAHRFDGAVIQHGRRDQVVPCVIQPRDLAIVRDVWRYKLMTAPQIRELWWPDGHAWPAQRRLCKLFDAGLLDRFRPLAKRGSYPWTYHLGELGHKLLCDAGVVTSVRRFRPRAIYDFGHVLHELQLNAWVLALRRGAGKAFLTWEGERDFEPPRQTRDEARDVIRRLEDDWSAEEMRDPRERPVRPDAVLEVARENGEGIRVLLIEFDRTGRVDKNLEKFRRYDTFLNWWWHRMPEALDRQPPCVIFVCQNELQREQFVHAADYELTGYQMPPSGSWDRAVYVGRRRIVFAVDHDAHAGGLDAWRLPAFPTDHPRRESSVQRVRLVSPA